MRSISGRKGGVESCEKMCRPTRFVAMRTYSGESPVGSMTLAASGAVGSRSKQRRRRSADERAAASSRLADFIPGPPYAIAHDESEYDAGGKPADVREVGYAAAGGGHRAAAV